MCSDGTVKYSDVDRFVCVDMDNPRNRFYNLFMAEKAGEAESKVAKIEFPYTPPRRPIEIWCEQLLTDYTNFFHDTIRIDSLRYIDPETGLHVQDRIDRCFKEEGTKMVKITRSEWDERKKLADELKRKFDETYEEVKARNPGEPDSMVYRETMRILNPLYGTVRAGLETEPECGGDC